MSPWERWKKTSLPNQLLVIIGSMAAFFTGLYALATVIQICLMERNSEIATKQTERMIEEAGRISAAIQDTIRQSKAALDASIESSRTDQRAWVGACCVIGPPVDESGKRRPFMKAGEPITAIGVQIKNTGRSPALYVQSRVESSALSKNTSFKAEYQHTKGMTPSPVVIQPGVEVFVNLANNTVPNEDSIKALSTGAFVYYIYGIINYEDVFRRAHQTTFCFFMRRDLRSFGNCAVYNAAN
jgi:hypothetical protein